MGATFGNGGPQSLVWGCLLVIVGSLAQAMSMAELGSILPIAGAQYHWTDMLAPEGSRRFITWMQGVVLPTSLGRV
jgi:choline transport protein